MLNGKCLCGAVTYKVIAPPKGPSVCHCGQCRTQSGHLWASAYVADGGIAITGEVRWFDSSDTARRGFCPTCGSFLFWQWVGSGKTSFSLGSLQEPTGMALEKHIFTDDKGDYYDIAADGLPQK